MGERRAEKSDLFTALSMSPGRPCCQPARGAHGSSSLGLVGAGPLRKGDLLLGGRTGNRQRPLPTFPFSQVIAPCWFQGLPPWMRERRRLLWTLRPSQVELGIRHTCWPQGTLPPSTAVPSPLTLVSGASSHALDALAAPMWGFFAQSLWLDIRVP